MKRLHNKRGSYIILLTISLCAMMILVYAVFYASGQAAIGSTVRSFGALWGRSVLGEYDRVLKERYGIFAFYADPLLTERKLDAYTDYTCRGKTYLHSQGARVELEGYSITEAENFETQIKEAVLAGVRPSPLSAPPAETSGEAGNGNRSISSRWILDSLPSAGSSQGVDVAALIRQIKAEISLKSMLSRAADAQYVFTYFRHALSDEAQVRQLGDTFFQNEIEYLISGKPDDARAKNYVRRLMKLLRNGLNLVYLYSCPEKREAALAAAQVLTPGPAAALTQALILESWALLEAENDLRILEAGEGVAIIKRDENWAVSLENVLALDFSGEEGEGGGADSAEGEASQKKLLDGFVKPRQMEGQCYEDYLKLFVAALPQKTRVLRMMDLIQINLKYLYHESFLLADYYIGLRYTLQINGKAYEFTETYQKTGTKKETS